MKCTKCGYVSFDYLSECKKCGVSLEATREGLGFGTAKPNIPSFLGPLLKDYVRPPEEPCGEEPESGFSFNIAEDEKGAAAGSDMDDELDLGPEDLLEDEHDPALDALEAGLGYEPEPEPVAPPRATQAATPVAVPAAAAEQPEGEDFSLLDITDEEMDLLIAADDDEKVGVVDEPLQMAEPAPTVSAAPEAETVLISAMDGDATRADAGSRPDPRPAREDADGLIPKFDVSTLPGLFERQAPAESEPVEAKGDKITVKDDGLEIALSEKDLKTLLADLEVASKKKEEKAE